MGPLALHGGGEFMPGDERFVDALLAAAAVARPRSTPLRIVVLPTAAARGRPDLAAARARASFERHAQGAGRAVVIEVAAVVDAASAEAADLAALLLGADLIHLPGGDPDLVPPLLDGSAAGRAVREAGRLGALIAGASAGAMALADWTWTPQGGIAGLGLVGGLAVVPHYDDVRRLAWQESLERLAPAGLGYLGLDERTGVISGPAGWRVAGQGAAWWFPVGRSSPVIARDGELLALPPRGRDGA